MNNRKKLIFILFLNISIFIYSKEDCYFIKRFPPSSLIYTNHARDRMIEREITEDMVKETYEKGELNCKKSSYLTNQFRNNQNYPRYALEKNFYSIDNIIMRVRIIIEDNPIAPFVITVIDTTDSDYPIIYKIRNTKLWKFVRENKTLTLVLVIILFLLSLSDKKEKENKNSNKRQE